MYERLLPEDHPDLTTNLWKICSVYEQQKDYKDTRKYYHQVYDIRRAIYTSEHSKLHSTLSTIAATYKKKVNIEEGLEFCLQQLEIQINSLGENHLTIAHMFMAIGDLYQDAGPQESLNYYMRALHVLEKLDSSNYTARYECYCRITAIYKEYDQYTQAIKYALRLYFFQQQHLTS